MTSESAFTKNAAIFLFFNHFYSDFQLVFICSRNVQIRGVFSCGDPEGVHETPDPGQPGGSKCLLFFPEKNQDEGRESLSPLKEAFFNIRHRNLSDRTDFYILVYLVLNYGDVWWETLLFYTGLFSSRRSKKVQQKISK